MNFLIKKDKHYDSNLFFKLTTKHSLRFECTFNENCLYEFINKDSGDINKLVGFSDDFTHLKNSVRIGWRCIDNKTIELHLFCHVDGIEKSVLITSVKPNETFYGMILVYDNMYFADIELTNKTFSKTIKRESKWNIPLRYLLKPYFGGDNKAPHNMDIDLIILR